jgi:hypothetical protein
MINSMVDAVPDIMNQLVPEAASLQGSSVIVSQPDPRVAGNLVSRTSARINSFHNPIVGLFKVCAYAPIDHF